MLFRMAQMTLSSELKNMNNDIYISQLTSNKACSDIKGAGLDIYINIADDSASSKIHDKRGDFNFCNVNYPHLDSDFPRAKFYGCVSLDSHVSPPKFKTFMK